MKRSLDQQLVEVPLGACKNCRYFGVMNDGYVCRFLPPKVFVLSEVVIENGQPKTLMRSPTAWPTVNPDEWCAKFSARRADA